MGHAPEQEPEADRLAVPERACRARLRVVLPQGATDCETRQLVTLVGSRRDCHLAIQHPDVSNIHCAIVHIGRRLLLCDLGSRRGTFVNDRPARVCVLEPTDQVRIGPLPVTIEITPGAETAEGCPTGARPVSLGADTFELADNVVVIGRRTTCDVVLDTPDVSLVHSVLFRFFDRPVICDLGSRSGTWLNGQRTDLAWLYDGDQVEIGGERLVVRCERMRPPGGGVKAEAVAAPLGTRASARASAPATPLVESMGALAQLVRATLQDLAAMRARLDERASELDLRQAELDALAASLETTAEQTRAEQARLARRVAEVEQANRKARERLAMAIRHEQAVTAAWEELDRWHAAREAKFQTLTGASVDGAPRPPASGLPDAPPVARPAQSVSRPPIAPGAAGHV